MQKSQQQMNQTIQENTNNSLVWQSLQEIVYLRQELIKYKEKDKQNQKTIDRQRKQV